MIIAITGYIGTGKTTAAEVFRKKGWHVINVDELGHELLNRPDVKHRLLAEFGSGVADRKMDIDRKKLAKVVLSDDTKLAFLGKTIHPVMKHELKRRLSDLQGDVVIDAALYRRLGIDAFAEKVILIRSDVDKLFERLKPKYTPEQVIRIMNSQEQPDADYAVDNNEGIEQLRDRISIIAEELKQRTASSRD